MLGLGWSLLNPLFQLLIFTFVFGNVLNLNIPHYASFVFAGLLAWSWFSTAMLNSSGAIVSNPEMVRRPGFPIGALPVLTVASSGISFLLALPVLFLFILIDRGSFGVSLLALPLVIALQFLFTLGPACIIAASNVRFRDTQHSVGLAMMFGFYLTPVFYDARSIPSGYHFLFKLNPVAVLIEAYRDILVRTRWPDPASLSLVFVASIVMLAIGYLVFDRTRARFAEEL